MAEGGWLKRLAAGLGRSSAKLGGGVAAIFGAGRIDGATLEELEELLIAGDLGVATAARLTAALHGRISGGSASAEAVAEALADEIATVLVPVARPLEIDPVHRPFVVLVAGVNGTGKTTTIGKLAAQLQRDGKSVLLVAGDTFRAAAVEQLKIWGARAGCPVLVREDSGADPAGLAFDALERARTGLLAAAVYARDNLFTSPRIFGDALTSGLSVEEVEAWPNEVRVVTMEQIMAAGRSVLVPRRSVTGLLLPAGGEGK